MLYIDAATRTIILPGRRANVPPCLLLYIPCRAYVLPASCHNLVGSMRLSAVVSSLHCLSRNVEFVCIWAFLGHICADMTRQSVWGLCLVCWCCLWYNHLHARGMMVCTSHNENCSRECLRASTYGFNSVKNSVKYGINLCIYIIFLYASMWILVCGARNWRRVPTCEWAYRWRKNMSI